MIDKTYNVRRYIAEYCEKTEVLVAKYDLASFDLIKFQFEFEEPNLSNPMLDCYRIKERNLDFIKQYIAHKILWDFDNKSYFVEAHI